jgi:hypothetical protein
MAGDRKSTERFTDAEAAFLRHVRFGELPARIPFSDMVELVETSPPHEIEEQAFDARVWGEAGRML